MALEELLQNSDSKELIGGAIKSILGNNENADDEETNNPEEGKQKEKDETVDNTKKSLLKLKKEFAQKYVEKNISDDILQVTGLVEDYMINDGLVDTLKGELLLKQIINGKVDEGTMQKLKETKEKLAKISAPEELAQLEKEIFEGIAVVAATAAGTAAINKPNTETTTETTTATTPENKESYTRNKLMMIDKVKENQQAFGEKVITISKDLNINPNRLMRIMNKESGLDHRIVNGIGATGLIQFLNSTAENLGTTTKELKNMSNVDQLDYVKKYFQQPHIKEMKSLEDVYLAVFYPAAMGEDDDYIIGSKDGKEKIVGKQNNMNDGEPVSVADVKRRINKDIPQEYQQLVA